ncbi:IspD/TarI family cytidylyltransferase [Desulfitobacterium hafniense]|uniref:2-C-methyl-D-erythritol 4-phosphate cytidylyltransferase n=1 Tax=Desulfitobacterium hafniense (strain Y51) TaxID=138119 RepID=Q24T42_DESHY|nr:IspD/TarI family cytidylyltransferase [Desulfitobacterium hafniense]BAE84800.1 hypothetical protein DSY3011 [Desulfitobacterium hafniense Y51]
MNAGIVLAGGTGSRMPNLGMPKQFAKICGRQMIDYCLQAFDQCVDIDKVVVVAADEWRDHIPRMNKFFVFAQPGCTRQQSIFNALVTLEKTLRPQDLVVVHDAARPLVTAEDLSCCVRMADGYDGAMPVLGLRDTVYQSRNGKTITALLNRDELFAGQAPECYAYGKYLNAHRKLSPDKLAVLRGSSEIAFKSGMSIRLYPGNPRNIKITDEIDLGYLEYLVQSFK